MNRENRWSNNCSPKHATFWLIRFVMMSFALGMIPAPVSGFQEAPAPDDQRREEIEFFEKSVRPVLVTHCSECHGETKQESGLRVDHIAFLKKGGDSGPAVIPGKPDESLLVAAIEHSSGLEMPPSKKLTEGQIKSIRNWIRSGAHWPSEKVAVESGKWNSHWSFQAITEPDPPKLKSTAFPVENAIDQFINSRITEQKLVPSEPADDFTLVRRAYMDLHGIGPTFQQVSQYLSDQRPDRFERLIDQLLESPRYGEMQARKWMDIARYADNKGYVFFEDKEYPWAYTYRDWLIHAFNDDMPFDEFIVHQLSADLLKENRSNLPALGFLTVGAKFVNNVHDQIDDRIDVVTRGLMGLTVSCARCHDHKFDPVPQADYYSLYGVFRSCYEPVVLPLFEAEPTTTGFASYQKELNLRRRKLEQFIEAQRKQITEGARTRIAEYLMAVHYRRHHPPTENFMTITDKGSLNPKMISRYEAYLNQAEKQNDPIWVIWHSLTALDDQEFPKQSGSVLKETLASKQIHSVVKSRFSNSNLKSMKAVAELYGEMIGKASSDFREDPAKLGADQLALANVLHGKGSPAILPSVLGWGFLDLIPDRPTQAEYQKLIKDLETFCKSGPHAPPRAMVLNDSNELFEPYIFLRGNPNRKGKTVSRGFLTAIPNSESLRGSFPMNQSGRLQLARAIASQDNPLTARVIVNRIWMQHFGRGLVTTPSDFGLQGASPSHPQLLDWLASWLIKHDWSMKKLHKLIMSSATYRRSSAVRQSHASIDPTNKWLARFNRRRLDLESMRDSMLMVSGTLDSRIGGKPIRNLFAASNKRRTLYGFINRMDLPGIMRTFDFPEPSATSGQREQTTVPARALFFLNHQFVMQCAEDVLRREEIKNASSQQEKVNLVIRALFGRDSNELEQRLASQFLSPRIQPEPVTVWKYGYGSLDEKSGRTSSFTELPHFTGTKWQGGPALPDPKLNWVYHSRNESHPGASKDLCAIRRWVAPEDCRINITGTLNHQPKQGNGIIARMVSSRDGILGSWTVHHSKTETRVAKVTVRKGDTIDFVSDFNSDISYDQHQWEIVMETIDEVPKKWDSVKQFRGRKKSAWVAFVHALLMTNEFMYVD